MAYQGPSEAHRSLFALTHELTTLAAELAERDREYRVVYVRLATKSAMAETEARFPIDGSAKDRIYQAFHTEYTMLASGIEQRRADIRKHFHKTANDIAAVKIRPNGASSADAMLKQAKAQLRERIQSIERVELAAKGQMGNLGREAAAAATEFEQYTAGISRKENSYLEWLLSDESIDREQVAALLESESSGV